MSAVPADQVERCECVNEHTIVGGLTVCVVLHSRDEQAVGSVDVAVAVEKGRGGGCGGSQARAEVGIGDARCRQHLSDGGQVAGYLRAQPRCLRDSSRAVGVRLAQRGGANQRLDRSKSVTSAKGSPCSTFEQVGHLVISGGRRFGQVPRRSLQTIRASQISFPERAMRVACLGSVRPLHDNPGSQRVAEAAVAAVGS